VLVEVTGQVANNNKQKNEGKGEKDGAVTKMKPTTKPPNKTGRIPIPKRVARAPSEGTTTSKTDSETTVDSKSTSMEVDRPLRRVKEDTKDEEEYSRVFKKRHTEEQLVVPAEVQDESQVEADKVAAELVVAEVSTAIQQWDDLDAEDWDDPVMISEYVVDVCVYLKEIEVRQVFPSVVSLLIFRTGRYSSQPRLHERPTRNYLGTQRRTRRLASSSACQIRSSSGVSIFDR